MASVNASWTPVHHFHRWRVIAAAVLVSALVAAACGSGDDATVTTPEGRESEPAPESGVDTDAPSEAAVSSGGTMADAPWADGIASFVQYELERREIVAMAGMLAGMRGGDRVEIAQWEIQCDFAAQGYELLGQRWPETPADAPPSWSAYVTDAENYWTTFASACAIFEADPDVFDEDPSFRDPVWAAEEAHVESCEAFLLDLEALASPSTVFPFCRYPNDFPIPVETFGDLPPELEEIVVGSGTPPEEIVGPDPREDVDPTSGPTSEVTRPEELVLLDPGAHAFEWFVPPITVTNEEPWVTFSEPDHMFFGRIDGPGELRFLAPPGIADPTQLITLEQWQGPDDAGIPMIPVPDDLTEWASQMPLLATSDRVVIGGLDATHWRFEYDPAADGNSVVIVAPGSQLRPYGAALGEEILHIWHIVHPDGPLFLIEFESSLDPGDTEMFDTISF